MLITIRAPSNRIAGPGTVVQADYLSKNYILVFYPDPLGLLARYVPNVA